VKSWRPTRPSPAMIVALLSLCVALGGSAIAATKLAPKNSVNSRAVINGSLKLVDFKKAERTKLKGDKGDPGPAGTPDGYTKPEADGKFLASGGTAADADKLDGVDSSGFVQGNGSVQSVFRLFADTESAQTFVTLPRMGKLGFTCDSPMALGFTPSNEVSGHVSWSTNDNGTLSSWSNGSGTSQLLNLGPTNHQIVAQFHRGQDNATVIISVFRSASGDPASSCRVQAQLIYNIG
jgi:hypothetical protein